MYWKINSLHGEYDVIGGATFSQIVEFMSQNDFDMIPFVDQNVLEHWPALKQFNPIVVRANEDTKTLSGIEPLINAMIDRGANSKSKIIAIGGGVVQDAVGFIASIWCRGVDYTLVPTTLLSQIDSCVGGKTSINHVRKNILGTFWPPKEIIICTDFLSTLSSTDYWSGWGEYIKYNILRDRMDNIINYLHPGNPHGKEYELIKDGLDYKIGIIQRDEFDRGERKFLNFGHTFGHALESVSEWKIPHGFAVFIGSLIAMCVSENYTQSDLSIKILSIKIKQLFYFGRQYLNYGEIKHELNPEWFTSALIDIAKKSDKKQEGGSGIKMVLIGEDGPYLHTVDNNEVLIKAIERVRDEICG